MVDFDDFVEETHEVAGVESITQRTHFKQQAPQGLVKKTLTDRQMTGRKLNLEKSVAMGPTGFAGIVGITIY